MGVLEVSAAEKIAPYRFRLLGDTDYPDGTSTPRIQYGTVTGYTDRAAVTQNFDSAFSGLYYATATKVHGRYRRTGSTFGPP